MFYVYIYLDPRKSINFIKDELILEFEPIYVGKGKNERHLVHLEIRKKKKKGSHPFYDKLNSIISAGYDPIIHIYKEFENEEDSLLQEKILIKKIGRVCDGTGTLLNLTEGGIGGDTFSGQSEEKKKIIREKRSESLKGKNLGKKMSDSQKEFLSNLYKGKKKPDHSIRMKGKNKGKKTSEKCLAGILKFHENNNPYWNKKIDQYTLEGSYIKTWKNYRELSDAGYDHIRIRHICDKKKGFTTLKNSLWEWGI